MSTKDGGPAFPVSTRPRHDDHGYGHQDGATTWQFSGMSLRDWLAGQAMAHLGPVLIEMIRNTGEVPTLEQVASLAYELADAVLAVREKGEGDAR